jgi:F-type H+-transporting ATPase subunit b
MTKRRLILGAGIFLVLLVAVGAVRAEEASNTDSKTLAAQELFKWINFAILAGGILWVFGKLLPPAFRGNAETIHSAIAKATAAKNEADKLLQDAQRKLASLEKEVAELRETASRESAAEIGRLMAATQSDEAKIAAAARTEIAAAERAARQELKALAAKLAVDGAKTQLATQLTPQVQESLVSEFVKSLEARPN